MGRKWPSLKELLEYFEAKTSKLPKSSDLHFLKGLLPHIERLPQDEKVKFQRGAMDPVTNIYDERAFRSLSSSLLSHDSSRAQSLNSDTASHLQLSIIHNKIAFPGGGYWRSE
jgi:hypothetical protein